MLFPSIVDMKHHDAQIPSLPFAVMHPWLVIIPCLTVHFFLLHYLDLYSEPLSYEEAVIKPEWQEAI